MNRDGSKSLTSKALFLSGKGPLSLEDLRTMEKYYAGHKDLKYEFSKRARLRITIERLEKEQECQK